MDASYGEVPEELSSASFGIRLVPCRSSSLGPCSARCQDGDDGDRATASGDSPVCEEYCPLALCDGSLNTPLKVACVVHSTHACWLAGNTVVVAAGVSAPRSVIHKIGRPSILVVVPYN